MSSQNLLAQFNAHQVDPTQSAGFKPLMLGKYPCQIVASEVKANKDAATGGQVVFEIEALDGAPKGQTGQWILNLYHNSEQTRQIAERHLSAVCHATGQFLITSTAALHNLPFALDVTEQALTTQQLADKEAGKNVTPFRQVRVLNPDGSEVTAMGGGGQQAAQQPQQNAQQPQGNAGGGWGGQQQPQGQQTAQQPAQGGAWGGGQQQPQQNTQQAPAQNNGGGWAQNAGGGGQKPSWGK